MKHYHVDRVSVLLILLSLLFAGCATSRGELDVKIPPQPEPAQGPAVRLGTITDARTFELKPDQPSIPSLKDGQIDNAAIKSRAIARKRNGYGKALGDILLPEGRTVEQLAGEAITAAFRKAGYRVVGQNQPEFATATPVDAEVVEFWSWMTPGFAKITLDFRALIRIKTALPGLPQPLVIEASNQVRGGSAKTSAWVKTIDGGLNALVQNLSTALAGSSAAAQPVAPMPAGTAAAPAPVAAPGAAATAATAPAPAATPAPAAGPQAPSAAPPAPPPPAATPPAQ